MTKSEAIAVTAFPDLVSALFTARTALVTLGDHATDPAVVATIMKIDRALAMAGLKQNSVDCPPPATNNCRGWRP